MAIGIISDTHGDVAAWEAAQVVFQRVDYVLHAGDVLNHGVFNPILETYDPKKLAEMMNSFPTSIVFAKGNCDSEVDSYALNYPVESPYALVNLEGLSILVHHGHLIDETKARDLCKQWKVDIFVSGHNHEYKIEESDGIVLINPGSPSLPKGKGIPTVGMIKNATIKIIDLDNRDVLLEKQLD